MSIPDRSTFETIYAGQAPWDIGKPQKPFIDVAEQITGSVLDAGCGTGDNALFFAGRGNQVTGIDFLEVPIQRAQLMATERGVPVTFLVKDALAFKDWNERFDNKPGGRLFLMCFSDDEPGTQGPRRVSRKEIENAFAEGWSIESIDPVRFEVRPDLKDFTFSEGGPKAWFVVVRRA